MIVSRAEIAPHAWDAFAFAHGGWIFHTSEWLSYELAWNRSEDRSFGVYHGDRLAAIVPYLALDGVPSYNGEIGMMPLGQNWRVVARARGLVGTVRGHPVQTPTEAGWPTRVVDTQQPEAALWADLRHSIKSPIRRLQETHTVIHGPLAGLMLERLYAEQAAVLPVIPAAGWAVIWGLAAQGWASFYAAVERETGRCDGAIGVYHHGDWSYYGAGRSLVPNVNACLLWHVLTHPVARYFELGWAARPWDDAKAKAIAFHKAALGGSLWHVPTWRL